MKKLRKLRKTNYKAILNAEFTCFNEKEIINFDVLYYGAFYKVNVIFDKTRSICQV